MADQNIWIHNFFEILLYQYAAKIAFVPEHLYVYRMGNNLSLSANPAPRAYSTLGNMIFLCQDLPHRQLAEPLFYNRIVNLTLKAVKRMRKYSFPPSYETGKLCRRAFETIQKNISYCSPIKRKKVKMICRFSKFIKDENGQGMLEYVLIIALVVIAIVGVVLGVRSYLKNKDLANQLNQMENNATA